MHREEGDVEADECDPEANPPETLRQRLAIQQRKEVVASGEDWEQRTTDQHVMKVPDDEEGVVRLEVERDDRHHYAGEAAEHEDHQTAEREEHRH